MSPLRCCLAGIAPNAVPLLASALAGADCQLPLIAERINVTQLGLSRTDLLVVDIDALEVDPIEMLRMTRFVLPNCIIAVYTDRRSLEWVRACHVAGANCVLSKESGRASLIFGLKRTLAIGCFTDPKFAA
jgi:DNA-binding NarL/FixJ family response regulator